MHSQRTRFDSNSQPRHHAHSEASVSSSISTPSPTITRNAQNTGATGGRSVAGTAVSGWIVPSQLWVRIRLPRRGIATS